MSALTGFLLTCAAVALLVGFAASLFTGALLRAAAPLLERLSPARRADLVFVAALLPLLAAVSVIAPSLSGLVEDHCTTHLHHLHLCAVHFGPAQPLLMAAGALALAVVVGRWGRVVGSELRAAAWQRDLVRLAGKDARRASIYVVPGATQLCHTLGLLKPRVLVSRSLLDALSPAEAHAALAHEEAHVARRDPLALFVLNLAGAFAFPFVAALLTRAYREAAELACDREAAWTVRDPLVVADTIVRVSRLRVQHAPAGAFALGAHPLEKRIGALLQPDALEPSRGRHFALALLTALACAFTALAAASVIHHAVESALHLLF